MGNDLRISTSIGTLVAVLCEDPNYPGIWLELNPSGLGKSIPIAKLEVYEDDDQRLMLDVYGDAAREDVTAQLQIHLEEE